MAVALNTTKRKFAKLLDNLTGAGVSSPISPSAAQDASPSTDAVSLEPSTKRARLSDIGAGSTERPLSSASFREPTINGRVSTDMERPRSVRLVKVSGIKQQIVPRKAPNYSPWSQDLFLERLRTFADVKLWTSKPEELSEVEWAKRGWTLDGWNKVACKGGCEQRLVIRLRPKRKDKEGKDIEASEDLSIDIGKSPERSFENTALKRETEHGLIDRYVDMIVTGHGEQCLWRKAGCKGMLRFEVLGNSRSQSGLEDIYHIPLARRDRCERDLRHRYQTLLSLESSLPPVESLSIPGDPPETLVKLVTASIFTTVDKPTPGKLKELEVDSQKAIEAVPPKINTIALALSMFGWTGVTQEGVQLLLCEHCFQRVGLWMYTASRIAEMSEKLGVQATQLRLNVLETHREHCPWKNAKTQHNPDDGILAGLSAWETLVNTLKRTRRDSAGDSRPSSSAAEHPPTSEPPMARNLNDAVVDTDTLALELTPEELEKRDRERVTKWTKLKARMSFKRPKSSSGRPLSSSNGPDPGRISPVKAVGPDT
jgi:hypothetical protein